MNYLELPLIILFLTIGIGACDYLATKNDTETDKACSRVLEVCASGKIKCRCGSGTTND